MTYSTSCVHFSRYVPLLQAFPRFPSSHTKIPSPATQAAAADVGDVVQMDIDRIRTSTKIDVFENAFRKIRQASKSESVRKHQRHGRTIIQSVCEALLGQARGQRASTYLPHRGP